MKYDLYASDDMGRWWFLNEYEDNDDNVKIGHAIQTEEGKGEISAIYRHDPKQVKGEDGEIHEPNPIVFVEII